MKRLLGVTGCICLLLTANSFAQNNLFEQVNQLELKGQFKQAATLLTNAMRLSSLPPVERKKLQWELDRLDRIKKDFPYTKQALFEELKQAVKDLTQEEFDAWVKEGR